MDFENKTFERNKAWGPRNVKLRFSRKLLYFSGILIAAEMANLDYDEKIARMLSLLAKPPLERIRQVCGQKSDEALRIYDYFLNQFSRAEVRSEVASVNQNDGSVETSRAFAALKDRSGEFSRALIGLLRQQYREDHPIHEALLM